MSGPHEDAGRAAQERLTEEARATASALLDWLGTRVDRTPGASGPRPAQSPGPCTWCPLCALVAALRGEQPELTARLAEQASGIMALLRLMVQAHADPTHGHHTHQAHHAHPDHQAPPPPPPDPGPPPGWPAEWGAWDGWGAAVPDMPAPTAAPTAPTSAPTSGAEAPDGAPTPPAAAADAREDAPDTPGSDTPSPHSAVPDTPGSDTPSPEGTDAPVGGRRRPPVRRASPRSAAFRGLGVPDTNGSPEVPSTPEPVPDPVPDPPRASRPARGARVPPSATSGAARPSVQRIAIRRPPRRDNTGGPDVDGPDRGSSC